MNKHYLKFGASAFMWLLGTTLVSGQDLTTLSGFTLNDLSPFKTPGQSWSLAASVSLNPSAAANELKIENGTGVLVNFPGKKNQGTDLLTNGTHGDAVIELDYLLAKGASSGVYLQGIYEIQLRDSWDIKSPLSTDNGGIYELYAPRQNASKAPGLWQHLRIEFQAPRFDASGRKISNARMLSVTLNGVLIHDNVELPGPAKGLNDAEKPFGGLKFQGDQGAVAFKNIKISKLPEALLNGGQRGKDMPNPIYIDAPSNTMIRSFVDLARDVRVVHAISVGSPSQVHYSYDLDNGMLVQGWRGDFIDATPMWDGRGNGTAKARGSVTRFSIQPVPAIAQLSTPESPWLADSTGTGFKTKGYVMDADDRPEFKYNMYGAHVTDAIKVVNNGQGLSRTISTDKPVANLYVLLAVAPDVKELAKGLYLIDGQSFYLKMDDVADRPIIRDVNGKKELIVLLRNKLNYSILF
ncbi:DUF1080 domain-containing protein [Pedobacter sp. MC2016-24]|uniref:3-keto-disaccharide hydrolase n=1 Tax=Pedobacter sp. MC2016-24 TaxID=2780090 RepID=UPI0018812285|nr:DUF1080 domain-containing protein [Pedobacter sp. MC2016-24]MBE9602587.1 DUF1080 domain-containing protein [Pedobacter sp. MC2016-24]